MKIFDELQKQVDAGAFAGIVAAVADGERILQMRAFGLADKSTGRPMQDDAVFWIASNSKPITATLLMMLVDDAKVSLNDPLEKYLPAFAHFTTPTITIRQAMNHTSGLPFFSRPEHTIDRLTLAEAAMSYAMSPRIFAPGTKYQYGNAGINTVGRIIEFVGGKPFESLLSERLFEPLGMVDTTFVPNASQMARLATAYKVNDSKTEIVATRIEQLHYPLDDSSRTPAPAGGLFSTASDVVRFGQMILNGGTFDDRRYLSPEAVATMTATQTGSLFPHHGPGTGYGIGWETFTAASGHSPAGRCGHGGALGNHLDINPQTGRVTVFLVQQQGSLTPEAGQLRDRLIEAAGAIDDSIRG